MNISLAEPLKSWVERQVEDRGYGTASEFVRDVLRRIQENESCSSIDAQLNAALDSAPATPMTREDWRRIRADGIRLAKVRRKK